jgi:hypothetical protein
MGFRYTKVEKAPASLLEKYMARSKGMSSVGVPTFSGKGPVAIDVSFGA